jgi:hypothetical protein
LLNTLVFCLPEIINPFLKAVSEHSIILVIAREELWGKLHLTNIYHDPVNLTAYQRPEAWWLALGVNDGDVEQ